MAETESASTPPSSTHQVEKTFRDYKKTDAAQYEAHRKPYSPILIDLIYQTHTSTGGQSLRVLDIGCGPGTATRQIAAYFQHVLGIDASASMIERAQETACLSSTGEQAQFRLCNSEDINKVFERESIDLITVATAAHWFDMTRFYVAAAKVLKPGGSIAMWCGGSLYPSVETTPNLEHVKALWLELEREILKPFEMPGNRMCRELYADLPLPWTIDRNSINAEMGKSLDVFEEAGSMRRTFNEDGKPEMDDILKDNGGYLRRAKAPLTAWAARLGTASQVTRWREAHAEQLEKGEIEDCVQNMLKLTKEEMAKVQEGKDRDWLEAVNSMVLVIVKKKA